MANNESSPAYIAGRKKYSRPQGLLFSDNVGQFDNTSGVYYPDPNSIEKEDFIILSDHNRSAISLSSQRIESRQRMINATMRSYHVADKINLSVSWENIPSRSFSRNIQFSGLTGKPIMNTSDYEYTVDGGAGGVELVEWYESHSGPFWVYIAYDRYDNFKVTNPSTGEKEIKDSSFNHLNVYNDYRYMFFSSFDHSVQKRGATLQDLWSVSLSLEEV